MPALGAGTGSARPRSRRLRVRSRSSGPKLRGTTEKFASRLFGAGVTRTNALESLVIAGYVRGLSDRDVEATLADALGAEAALSKLDGVAGVRGRSRPSSRPGRASPWPTSSWTTCSWTGRSSRCTTVPAPNRCSPRGASPPHGAPVLVGLAPGWWRVHRRLGGLPDRPDRPWAAPTAADHQRRRPRPARRPRAGVCPVAAAAVPDPLCRPPDYADVVARSLAGQGCWPAEVGIIR